MSTSMNASVLPVETAHSGIDAQCTDDQSGTTRHRPLVLSGFITVGKHGEFISWAEFIEVATMRARELDDAHIIIRCSDDVPVTVPTRPYKATRL